MDISHARIWTDGNNVAIYFLLYNGSFRYYVTLADYVSLYNELQTLKGKQNEHAGSNDSSPSP